jgi:hypothetical protein
MKSGVQGIGIRALAGHPVKEVSFNKKAQDYPGVSLIRVSIYQNEGYFYPWLRE